MKVRLNSSLLSGAVVGLPQGWSESVVVDHSSDHQQAGRNEPISQVAAAMWEVRERLASDVTNGLRSVL